MKKTNKRDMEPSKSLGYAILAIAAVGVLLTVLIEMSHQYPWIAELCGSTSCEDVQSTQFGKMFGISVAYWGLLSYVTFIFLAIYAPIYTLPLVAALLGSELYFLWVMDQVLQTYCMFCLIQLALVSVLFVTTLFWHIRAPQFALPGKMWSVPVVVALVFIALVAPVKMRGQDVSTGLGQLITYSGDINSKVRVEVFSDYGCGYCKKLEPELDKISENYPGTLIVFRDFIIRSHSMSPLSVSFANGIAFTKGREAFLKTRTQLFKNQHNVRKYLEKHLKEVEFTQELKEKIRVKVTNDRAKAKAVDVSSTPTMVIYRGGDLVQIVRGYKKYERFSRFLKQ